MTFADHGQLRGNRKGGNSNWHSEVRCVWRDGGAFSRCRDGKMVQHTSFPPLPFLSCPEDDRAPLWNEWPQPSTAEVRWWYSGFKAEGNFKWHSAVRGWLSLSGTEVSWDVALPCTGCWDPGVYVITYISIRKGYCLPFWGKNRNEKNQTQVAAFRV